MNRSDRRRYNAEVKKLPRVLTPIPESYWPGTSEEVGRFACWKSRKYLVQLFQEPDDIIRMTVCRVQVGKGSRWNDDITWDELNEIKAEIGYFESWAVEMYPPDDHLVNVANMRHLWILPEAPGYGWRSA